MATPAELETALIARIQASVPEGVLAKAYPDNPRTYKIFAPAEVLVVFRGGDYQPPQKTDLVIQERTLQFELSVVVRSLAGHTGAYALLETVRQAIQRWTACPLSSSRTSSWGWSPASGGGRFSWPPGPACCQSSHLRPARPFPGFPSSQAARPPRFHERK